MLSGARRATQSDFARKSHEYDYQYEEQWQQAKSTYRVAVSKETAVQLPTLPTLLRVVAAAPDNSSECYSSGKLEKYTRQKCGPNQQGVR